MTSLKTMTEGNKQHADSVTELTVSLPTRTLLLAVIGTVSVVSICWPLIAIALGAANNIVLAGAAAAVIVGTISMTGVLIMVPWKARSVSAWTTMWLAATVMRLFMTPVATFLIYSATSLEGVSFILAVALTYLVTLLAEVVVIAKHMNRSFQNAASRC